LTGSIPILKKIQNGVVLVKKKKNSTGYNQVFDRVLPSQPGHGLCNFFINPAWFQPRAGAGRVSKH
jgi:hypothetical protein